MDEIKRFTLEEADLHFAKALNGKVWELLQKPERSRAEDEQMIHAAHASCYHWLSAGTNLHYQRAEWLIAHVYTELGLAASALYHAYRCLELTNQHADLMMDFDRAYAYEAVARANALAGNQDEALQYLQLAEASGRTILNEEDKNIFLADFNGGDWHGLKSK
jgi:hypothetical protein